MGYRQTVEIQISQNVVSDQETLEMSQSQNNCPPESQSILVHGSYMNHFLLMRTNSHDNGASVKMHKLACFLTFCMRQIPKTYMLGSNTIHGMH